MPLWVSRLQLIELYRDNVDDFRSNCSVRNEEKRPDLELRLKIVAIV